MGLFDVLLRPLRSPIVTGGYPPRADVPDRGHRGTPVLRPELCGATGDCATVCPTGAIGVQRRADGTTSWQLDYGLCIFCGRCVEQCPEDAMTATDDFELSARRREDVIAVHTLKRVARA
jgi:formate hydrogenlyase subunit 6/NADH:ubiquinone oxidoreductase subunit I